MRAPDTASADGSDLAKALSHCQQAQEALEFVAQRALGRIGAQPDRHRFGSIREAQGHLLVVQGRLERLRAA